MLRLPFLALLLALALLVGGCGGNDATEAQFQEDIVAARDEADAELAQIVEARSLEDLFERMRTAAVGVRRAAGMVREADTPKEFRDERDDLAARLIALSDEIVGTVETLEAFPEQANQTKALSFTQWDAVQAELESLREQGIQVPPLERHVPTSEIEPES